MTITGKATFQGQPLANADLHVVDALNDTVAPVVAAGGGNIVAAGGGNIVAAGGGNIVAAGGGNIVAAGGGNIVAAGGGNIVAAGGGNIVAAGGGNIVAAGGGNLRTDAQGNFSIQVAGLTGGNAARLVVAAGGSAVSTLVTGGGGLMGKYTIQQTGGTLQAPIDEVTTTISHLANGTLKLSRLLRREASGPIINEMLTGLRGKAEQLKQEFDRQKGLGNALVQETDPTTGAPKNTNNSVLPVIVGNAGVRKAIFDLNKATLKAIAKAATDSQNQAPNRQQVQQQLQGVPLAGTGLTVSLTDSSLSVRTGSGTTIDLSTSDSSKLDTALNSATFEQSFAPPATSSSSGGGRGPVDTTAPDAPIISGIPTSGLQPILFTNDTTPDITGTAEANAIVDIYDGAAKIATVTANDWGNWTVTLPTLTDGAHDLTAKATDAHGNTGIPSGIFTLTVDTSAPNAPSVAGITAATDSGVSNNDRITNVPSPMLQGTAEAKAVVEVFDNGGALTLISATADASGNWAIQIPAMAEGPHNLVVKATDKAGNTSAGSAPVTLIIDMTAPVPPATIPDLADASDTGLYNADNLTFDVTPTITGQATDEFVNLYDNSGMMASYVQTVGGSWTFTPTTPWAMGSHNIKVRSVDRAGNESFDPAMSLNITVASPLLENVPVGSNPFGLAFDNNRNTWVANSSSNNVTRISSTGSRSTFTVGSTPKYVAVDPSSGNAWVVNQASNNVTRITTTGSLSTYAVGTTPVGLVVDATGNAWVANQASNNVTRISSSGIISTVSVGTNPQSIVLDRTGSIWVANGGSSNITRIISTSSISTIGAGGSPAALAVDSNGNAWVALKTNNTVVRVTPSGSQTIIPVGTSPVALAIDAMNNVWVANSGSSNVTRINPDGFATTFPVGTSPKALTVDAAGNVWVANFDSGSVTHIDSTGYFSTFPTGSSPYNVAVAPNGSIWVANYGASTVTCISSP